MQAGEYVYYNLCVSVKVKLNSKVLHCFKTEQQAQLLSAHGIALELYYGVICILLMKSFRYEFLTKCRDKYKVQ